MFKARKGIKKAVAASGLIWLEKPEAKPLIWINVQHHESGVGGDVGSERAATFANICSANSAHGHSCCSGGPAGGNKSRAHLSTIHNF